MEDKNLNKNASEKESKQDDQSSLGKFQPRKAIPIPSNEKNGHLEVNMSDHSEEDYQNGSDPGCSPHQRNCPSRERYFSTDSASGSEDEQKGKISEADKRQRVETLPKKFIIPGLAASPPRFVSLEQIMKAANGVTNMALAHEIAVDKDFKLERVEPPEKSLERQVKDIIHKAFWDAFESQLQEIPPNYGHAMILLSEIKEGLLSILLPHHTKLRDQISEVLDIDLIKQQAENNALDFHYYAQYIISIMAKLCAPVRDDKIRELMAITDVVPMYREILQLLDLMKLDMANFTIQQMRPHIQQQSVEYEKKKFAEFLESQEDGLEYTKAWLKRTMEKMSLSKTSPRESVSVDNAAAKNKNQEKCLSANEIIHKAYMALLEWNDNWIFPETLLMDQARFIDLRDKIIQTTVVASLLLVTYSTVGQAIIGLAEFKAQLKQHITIILNDSEGKELASVLENVAIQIINEVNECLQKHGFSRMSEQQEKNLKGQLESVAAPDCHVRQLVYQRFVDFISEVLVSTTASPIRIPPGLSSMQPELARITGQFLRLVSHNRAVFGDYYVDIIDTLNAEIQSKLHSPDEMNGKVIAAAAE